MPTLEHRVLSIIVLFLVFQVQVAAQPDFFHPIQLSTAVNNGATWEQSISGDGTELFFASQRTGGEGNFDIWTATRDSMHEPWTNAENLGPLVNTSAMDGSPDISSDGLHLYFNSERSGGEGGRDLWYASRPTVNEPWSEAENLGSVINSRAFDAWPTISSDGNSLYFVTDRNISNELVVSQRASPSDPWGEPMSLGVAGGTPDISSDGLSLFFASSSKHGDISPIGGFDIWVMQRASTDDEFDAPMLLSDIINKSSDDFSPNISEDGLLFTYYSQGAVREVTAVWGDVNHSGVLDVGDIDLVTSAQGKSRPMFDLTEDREITSTDREVLIKELMNTYFGDANLDGEFNSRDLVEVSVAGEYEDGIAGNSGWAEGDWNGDGDFTTSDLVAAFEDGGYEQGPRVALNVVPEPSSILLITIATLGLMSNRRCGVTCL